MSQPPDLEPVPEDWNRALAVVAHPDDMEYGAAAAVARWTAQGKHVEYLLVTAGEAGIQGLPPDEVAPARRDEQVASCAVVGVTDLEILDFPDGTVEESLELRKALTTAIRASRPDVVVSINYRTSWGGPSWNHADHRAVGVALLDAVRDAANRWIFPPPGGGPADDAWSGVRFVAFNGSPDATHGVDVTDTFERGVESLRCHALYLSHLDPPTDPDDFLRGHAERDGARLGVDLATSFELVQV